MTSFVALLRGINVGGKNLIKMPDLADCFRDAGFADVRTYIQSGNVLFSAQYAAGPKLENTIEQQLEARFGIPILVVVRSQDELSDIIAAAPPGHDSTELRSDVFFFKHPLDAEPTLTQLPELREGVDAVALGPGVIYFSRVAAQAAKTRMTRILGMPFYRKITIRNWRTTTRLSELLSNN